MTNPQNPIQQSNQLQVPGQIYGDDPFGSIKQPVIDPNPSPEFLNQFHKRSDRDTSQVAQHHTLGAQHNQASPGDHVHDGVTSKKLMTGITVSGNKGGNAALTDLIPKLAQALGFNDSTGP